MRRRESRGPCDGVHAGVGNTFHCRLNCGRSDLILLSAASICQDGQSPTSGCSAGPRRRWADGSAPWPTWLTTRRGWRDLQRAGPGQDGCRVWVRYYPANDSLDAFLSPGRLPGAVHVAFTNWAPIGHRELPDPQRRVRAGDGGADDKGRRRSIFGRFDISHVLQRIMEQLVLSINPASMLATRRFMWTGVCFNMHSCFLSANSYIIG